MLKTLACLFILCTTLVSADVCTAQTCGNYTSGCSSNSHCYCFKTSSGSGFCGNGGSCSYPDCTSCNSSTSVCLINTCCGVPVCVPLSEGQPCTDPITSLISKWKKPASAKRSSCKQDQDCDEGKVCKLHLVGSYCV